MPFDRRDIRPRLDVYTLDNAYLGSVLRVIPGEATPPGEQVPPGARQSSSVLGETLGPMPTQSLGNRGPRAQSAQSLYATLPDGAQSLGRGAIEVGRWGVLFGRRTITLDDVQTVSLERVVLRLKKDELSHLKR